MFINYVRRNINISDNTPILRFYKGDNQTFNFK